MNKVSVVGRYHGRLMMIKQRGWNKEAEQLRAYLSYRAPRGSSNLISQSRLMNANFNIEPVNHYGLNIYNPHGALIATAPQIDCLFCLDVHSKSPTSTVHFENLNVSPMLAAVKKQAGVHSSSAGFSAEDLDRFVKTVSDERNKAMALLREQFDIQTRNGLASGSNDEEKKALLKDARNLNRMMKARDDPVESWPPFLREEVIEAMFINKNYRLVHDI
jgi:hypothetical protein